MSRVANHAIRTALHLLFLFNTPAYLYLLLEHLCAALSSFVLEKASTVRAWGLQAQWIFNSWFLVILAFWVFFTEKQQSCCSSMNTTKEGHKIVKLSRGGIHFERQLVVVTKARLNLAVEHRFWMQERHWLGKYMLTASTLENMSEFHSKQKPVEWIKDATIMSIWSCVYT